MEREMINLLFLIVSFSASLIGAICGIGGGVIIKPLLDSLNVLSVSAISFLSGCTVLAMSTYNVIKGKLSKDSQVKTNIGLPLAIGAASGGIIGKILFSYIQNLSSNPDRVGSIQAISLGILVLGTLIYTINKDKIKTLNIQSSIACLILGLCLGVFSSFLGIGGGPFNIVVLYFFFSMETKEAGEYSIYTIFFSQLANLIYSLIKGNIPEIGLLVLTLMIIGGITGGIFGRNIKRRIKSKTVDKLFIGLMIVIIGICIYNTCLYMN